MFLLAQAVDPGMNVSQLLTQGGAATAVVVVVWMFLTKLEKIIGAFREEMKSFRDDLKDTRDGFHEQLKEHRNELKEVAAVVSGLTDAVENLQRIKG